MIEQRHRRLFAGVRVTSLGTLASRVLGMVRDMATAALLGMSSGGVMDAFVIAFRIPNLFRRLFGEGALTASYLPVLTEKLENDRPGAWQLASVTMTWLAMVLVVLVLVAEGVCGLLWITLGDREGMPLLLGLSAVLLPYSIFICIAAQIAATLHALSVFHVPALVGIVLNVCWIVAAVLLAPALTDDPHVQAYLLGGSVLVAGVLQVGVQLPALYAHGFRFDYNVAAVRDSVGRIMAAMGPTMLGLAVTQINTLMDSVIAWSLSASPDHTGPVAWLGGVIDYPMRQGAAAAVYFGERMYQLPVGIFGVAVATVIFPLLSRHAAKGQHDKIGADLTVGLRLVVFLAVPATAGLVLLAEPITRLLFERGQWDPSEDTPRTARMIAAYASGVWAYCALPVMVRGFYAVGDYRTPVRVGALMVALNLTLNLTLIWPLGEHGLAVATAIAAAIQLLVLLAVFSRRQSHVLWGELFATAARTTIATAVMVAIGMAVTGYLEPSPTTSGRLIGVFVPLVICTAVYLPVVRLLGGHEAGMLLGRGRKDGKSS
jgi:putative peptidoglycan lipid II flippase